MSDIEDTNFQQEVSSAEGGIEQASAVPLENIYDLPEKSNLPVALTSTRKLPLEVMFDVPISLVFEVGRTKISIKNLMELRQGSFVELNQVSVDVIDVRINEKLIAHAETIAMQNRYGIRMGEIEAYSALENEAVNVSV